MNQGTAIFLLNEHSPTVEQFRVLKKLLEPMSLDEQLWTAGGATGWMLYTPPNFSIDRLLVKLHHMTWNHPEDVQVL